MSNKNSSLKAIDETILKINTAFALFEQVPVSVINCVKEKYYHLQYMHDGSVDIQLYVEKEGVFLLYKLHDPEYNCFAIDYVFDYTLDGVAVAFYNALKSEYTATFNGLNRK